MKIMLKLFQYILLPLIITGAFFVWSLPRITTDYNFNADELIYLGRSLYWDAYKSGDFQNPIWSSWEVYDQPQLTNYIFAQVPGDHNLLANSNSPCTTAKNADHYIAWGCLDGKPIDAWPDTTHALQSFVTRARTLATAISSLAIMTTYYLGFLVSGPVAGVLAVLYLGTYSFFRGLSTMVMEDQTILLFLNLQLISTLLILRHKRANLLLYLALGLVTGLAFATKLSAAIPTIIIYTYLLIHGLIKKQHNFAKIIASAIFSMLIFIGLHPFLWSNPVGGMIKMLEWRNVQIMSQAGSPNELKTLTDKVIYSLNESFSSFRGEPETIRVVGFVVLALISLLALFFTSPHFALISTFITLTFVIAVPLSWARYLLPIMPTLAVYLGSIPIPLFRTFTNLVNILKKNSAFLKQFGLGAITALFILTLILALPVTNYISLAILSISTLLLIQGYLVTRTMLYGMSARVSPAPPTHTPSRSFSLIVPARDEAGVIASTIQSLSSLDYPAHLFEVIVLVRADDTSTLSAANQAISHAKSGNIRLVEIDGDAHTKSYSLNLGIALSQHEIIGIFDAEDEPSVNILRKVNSYFSTYPTVGAVQAPVHLTNLESTWFSGLAAAEYYYWFRSVLPFLAKQNIVLLGGNTIFIQKSLLKNLGGYDESCLTEDAELGIRLAANHIKVGVIDDMSLATHEESPNTEYGVIRQRSRWDQGYLQVLDSMSWGGLAWRQKLLALYTLTQPIFRHLAFLNMIFAPLLSSLGVVPPWVTLLSFLPLYFLLLQLGLYLLALSELSTLYKIKLSPWRYLTLLLAFVPYQALLTLATLRAIGKILVGNYSWDKTQHFNSHRPSLAILEA